MVNEYPKESQPGLLAQAQHYGHMILKWKWMAFLFFLAAVLGATAISFIMSPVYTASGSVWIEDDPNILPFEEVQSSGTAASNIQSHARLLRSRALASSTIDKLKLWEIPDFTGKQLQNDASQDPNEPVYREYLVQRFLDNVSTNSVPGTRLVDVRYSNRNPKLAAEILNALFDGYIEMLVKKRYSASERATVFLNTQIEELRAEIDERERKLNDYGSQQDILPLTAAEAPAVDRIANVNKALMDATIERINKYSYYNQLKTAPLGEIPEAPEGSLIQRLREQYITLRRQYATRLSTVRPEYPEMRRLKSELDAATEALQAETENLVRNAYNDYQTALRKEQSLKGLLEVQKNEAYKANSNSVIYNSLRIELESRKELLESLSKRQSETDVSSRLKGLDALNVWLVDRADYPLKPASPNKKKNILIGLVLGLFGGLGLALGLELLNHSVKTSRDISYATGIPTLGSIPAFESETKPTGPQTEFIKIIAMLKGGADKAKPGHNRTNRRRRKAHPSPDQEWLIGKPAGGPESGGMIERIVLRDPNSIQAESYRSIRTALLVSSPPGRVKTLLFTSPLAREGKSSTVANLGIALAEADRRILIVDSDLRKPKQARIFGLNRNSEQGLSRYLSSTMEPEEVIMTTEVPHLGIILSGPTPPNPIELLTSERMDRLIAYLKKSFDYVLFDAPPLLAVSDALAMGPMADSIILVVRAGQTPIPALKQAKQKLDAHKLKSLGVILNGVDLFEQDGYYAREYYQYSKAD
jgi:succinoglycan biosynthesis transport protein ExoP